MDGNLICSRRFFDVRQNLGLISDLYKLIIVSLRINFLAFSNPIVNTTLHTDVTGSVQDKTMN